jgi:hypothetical protein
MWKLLSGEKLVHEQAMKRLDARFATHAPKRVPTVLLVDELDMLCKRKQTVLYNLFEWPSRPTSRLVIIAVANTMDLPERDMDMRVISRLGLNRLHFEPYTQQQLQVILVVSVPDLDPPDPYVFGSPGSGSISQRYGSGSGSLYHHTKLVRKTLIPTNLLLFLTFYL